MSVLYTNNASTTLATGITSGSTSISVASGTGSLFPAISGSDFFYVTLANTAGTVEIVKVTARSTDTLTVVRGQEGTTAVTWSAGDKVELRITKAMLDQLKVDAVSGYALDSAVVHKTGTESVAGVKTFTDGIISSSVQLSGGTGAQGRLSWNTDEETADLIQNGATLQLGQELQVHCRNNTASNIANATVVMATGTLGASGRITIAPWDGTTDIKYVLGVSTEVIEAGTDGKVTTFGKVRDVDTGAISGTLTTGVIYAKTDGTGGLTYTKPAANALPLAFLVSAETSGTANNGTIMVRVTPVSEITLDHAETAFTHVSNTSNPHNTTATQVGLGNVTNESKATMFTSPTFTGHATVEGVTATGATGTGKFVFDTSPTLVTPVLGTPASGNFSTGTFTWPTFNQNTSGTAAGLSATLATTSGGTGLTSFTSGGVVYASSTSALTTGSGLVFDGTNLGIGTASPAYKLDVSGNIGASVSNSQYLLDLSTNNVVETKSLGWGAKQRWSVRDGSNNYYYIDFDASGNLSLASGNLGIGTASPTVKLDVYNSTNADQYWRTSSVSLYAQANNTNGSGLFGTITNHPLAFWTNSAERMRLDTSGNLGLGVTPSAWVSPALPAFDIGTTGGIAGQTNAANLHITSNAYLGSGPAWKYKTSNYAGRFTVGNDDGTGGFSWYTAPSGTAGNAITWNQAMTLDSSGNLLVGTTSVGGKVTSGIGSASNNCFDANFSAAGGAGVGYNSRYTNTTGTAYHVYFSYNGTGVGSIQSSSTTTSYITSSDYRLKEDYQPVADAIVRLNQLKPINFAWKVDGSRCDGFLAHELQEVIPEAATGTKDETKVEEYEVSPKVEATFDEEGNELTPAVEAVMGEREVPVYQGIDQSKIVPLLTAALQEAIKRMDSQQSIIESLTERIEKLEAKGE